MGRPWAATLEKINPAGPPRMGHRQSVHRGRVRPAGRPSSATRGTCDTAATGALPSSCAGAMSAFDGFKVRAAGDGIGAPGSNIEQPGPAWSMTRDKRTGTRDRPTRGTPACEHRLAHHHAENGPRASRLGRRRDRGPKGPWLRQPISMLSPPGWSVLSLFPWALDGELPRGRRPPTGPRAYHHRNARKHAWSASFVEFHGGSSTGRGGQRSRFANRAHDRQHEPEFGASTCAIFPIERRDASPNLRLPRPEEHVAMVERTPGTRGCGTGPGPGTPFSEGKLTSRTWPPCVPSLIAGRRRPQGTGWGPFRDAKKRVRGVAEPPIGARVEGRTERRGRHLPRVDPIAGGSHSGKAVKPTAGPTPGGTAPGHIDHGVGRMDRGPSPSVHTTSNPSVTWCGGRPAWPRRPWRPG